MRQNVARPMWLVLLAGVVAFSLSRNVAAQPSSRQIKKDLWNKTVKKIKFSRKRGTKQWNSSTKVWEFVRGVEIVRDYPDIKGVDLIVIGNAVYQEYGSKYRYWKFRVAENRYTGIPNPTEKEILAIVNKDLQTLVSSYWYNRIVGEITKLRLADEPRFVWSKPTRVSFRMVAKYSAIVSNTDVESVQTEREVTLSRGHHKAPWKPVFSSAERARTSLGKKSYPSGEIRKMATLGKIDSERRAKAALDSLPTVKVPEFKSGRELVLFTHKMLRHSSPEKFQAFMMQVLAPHFFVAGSTTQLNQRGADIINHNVGHAYKKKGTYKLEYCENPGIDKRRTTKTRFYLLGAINKVNTMIAVGVYGGKYVDGKKTAQQWKIAELYVGTRQDDDALQYINSFSDRKKLCKND